MSTYQPTLDTAVHWTLVAVGTALALMLLLLVCGVIRERFFEQTAEWPIRPYPKWPNPSADLVLARNEWALLIVDYPCPECMAMPGELCRVPLPGAFHIERDDLWRYDNPTDPTAQIYRQT